MRTGLAFAAGLIGGLWLDTARRTHEQPRTYPPRGRFVDAAGVRLHAYDRGGDDPAKRPAVLIHGAGITADDWDFSGILNRAAADRRCVAFDRPGQGHSAQPPGAYDPASQARILRDGARALGLERPILVGQSLGGAVALAWALQYPEEVAGVVFIAGFAYPTPRADLIPFMGPAVPVLGPAMSRTVLPPLDRLILPALIARIFQPDPVPESYRDIPVDVILHPTRLQAGAAQLGALIPAMAEQAPRYPDLRVPLTIIAGTDDRILTPRDHSIRLHREVPGSTLHLLSGHGHMVHHMRPDMVLDAIERLDRTAHAESGMPLQAT
ncbi:alpha/beta fold hydrolase [Azospirillum thermophilum]|uniref:alpha/beta fold hydrolase n=1 Tax=Azospirillum thermophilum TaxID=2202148 RepID=UPI00143CC43B|nr:alpha/beta hydrolase [Azospirillum thermophilum]